MKILVVDDQQDIRQLLCSALRIEGFTVVEAASGAEALAVLEQSDRPDLVVLDIQMPIMDGWDVLRAIRERPDTADLPVTVCSVKSRLGDADRAWKLGADGYVKKPFVMSALMEEVRRVIGSAPVDREATRRRALEEIERAVMDSGASTPTG